MSIPFNHHAPLYDRHLVEGLEKLALKQQDTALIPPTLTAEHAPIVRYVQQMIEQACHLKASDIHFDPTQHHYRIRIRQDGVLREIANPPATLAQTIAARIKILAQLDIAEKRLPQEGRFKQQLTEHQSIDIRVSICPTLHGEKIVLRLLNAEKNLFTIDALGYEPWQQALLFASLKKPHGLILVTGPTGSGKTMSLYAALNVLNTEDLNILTIEDPVEIQLPGINQVGVNGKITFSRALRTFLRQDPDVIMVGEIRDRKTARIAIQAAQTGHLVLSTLHTHSSIAALMRLIHLGIPAYHLATSISLIIAQRLIRTRCNLCRSAQGCPECWQGYRGRTGIYELLPMAPPLRNQLLHPLSQWDMTDTTLLAHHQTLYQAGLNKVKQGITSKEEILRVLPSH